MGKIQTPQIGIICKDCEEVVSLRPSTCTSAICHQCHTTRIERRETILEIFQTELNYGRDLKILLVEFYGPIKEAGLINNQQLTELFLNLEELVDVNENFIEQLNRVLNSSPLHNDKEVDCVNIGQLFQESIHMFKAFEKYCVKQSDAMDLLEKLETENDILRAFLQVTQAENTTVRRMSLKSFLMVPVQRVMKYPLLLNRLYKSTPQHHRDSIPLHESLVGLERILEEINAKIQGTNTLRLTRKRSELRRHSSSDKFELIKTALGHLNWSQEEIHDILVSSLLTTQPQDHFWTGKKVSNLKFSQIHAVLLTRGEPQPESSITKKLLFTQQSPIQQAALVTLRCKGSRYQLVREPLFLDKCVITLNSELSENIFEVQDWNKETYLFKGEDDKETKRWVEHLKRLSRNLGVFWRRRNALPDINSNSKG
ncbi:neuroepithelial cell-transforming gene 1 protein-like isoform X1 [Octopus vulgaris]|uniref:Neuroepithelial cell-transforming gene 1 protein-like isoform X1 n=1 Tax=Octopus vulgaris TaxID=6645 RepID=A0AA36AL31_OCTVU|nr:neuroepithelial cell-transforming gene 1 protein-like isoform X1 [Octopus vulgaris]